MPNNARSCRDECTDPPMTGRRRGSVGSLEESQQCSPVPRTPHELAKPVDWSHRPTLRHGSHVGVLDQREQEIGDRGPCDLERSIPQLDDRAGDGFCQLQPVVHGTEPLVRGRHCSFALLPVRRPKHVLEDRHQLRTAGQAGERRAEPLRVRRVLALHQEAQPHDVGHQARSTRTRAHHRRTQPCRPGSSRDGYATSQ